MKKMRFLHYITALALLCSLLLGATGCGKDPVNTDPTGTQTATTNATENAPTKETQSQTATTEATKATEATTATEPSAPTETTGPACEHIPGNWSVSITSTCTTEGSRHKLCTLCSAVVMTEVIPKINHTPGNWKVDKAATCTEEGKQHQKCTQCDTTLITITVAKKAHNEIIVRGYNATDTKNGLTDGKRCSICKEITQPQYTIPANNNFTGFAYLLNSDQRSCSVIYLGTGHEVTIPDTLAGYTVSALGDNAFADQAALTKITIPASVKAIGKNAFSGCSALVDITYNGDRAGWNSLSKGAGWDTETGEYNITCINGVLSK